MQNNVDIDKLAELIANKLVNNSKGQLAEEWTRLVLRELAPPLARELTQIWQANRSAKMKQKAKAREEAGLPMASRLSVELVRVIIYNRSKGVSVTHLAKLTGMRPGTVGRVLQAFSGKPIKEYASDRKGFAKRVLDTIEEFRRSHDAAGVPLDKEEARKWMYETNRMDDSSFNWYWENVLKNREIRQSRGLAV